MVVSEMVRDGVGPVIRALTPVERWSAARRLEGGNSSIEFALEHWFLFAGVAALLVLVLLLWWATRRRVPASDEPARELFAENAVRRGLSSRERQILLAIVMRSGLGQSHDIFTTVDAFDRGATKLLAECIRARTPNEIERLKTEVTCLREKLGFQALRTPGGLAASRRPSSRDIPVGKPLEVTRRRERAGATIRGEVVRNDDLELAIELETPVASNAGDFWRARYTFGMSVWEFDTTALSCEAGRLVLNHVEQVRYVNRRRFPRVAVTMPALVAHFPFMKGASSQGAALSREMGLEKGAEGVPFMVPVFVHGVVTELAGPGLRIEAPLEVREGDRVLLVFRPSGVDRTGVGDGEAYVIEDVGHVRHCRRLGAGVSMAVELTSLSDGDIDELVRLTNAISAKAEGVDDDVEDNAVVGQEGVVMVQEV